MTLPSSNALNICEAARSKKCLCFVFTFRLKIWKEASKYCFSHLLVLTTKKNPFHTSLLYEHLMNGHTIFFHHSRSLKMQSQLFKVFSNLRYVMMSNVRWLEFHFICRFSINFLKWEKKIWNLMRNKAKRFSWWTQVFRWDFN